MNLMKTGILTIFPYFLQPFFIPILSQQNLKDIPPDQNQIESIHIDFGWLQKHIFEYPLVAYGRPQGCNRL